MLLRLGPSFGYFMCVLVVKRDCVADANELFGSTGIEIVVGGAKGTGSEPLTEGARHLGAAVGSSTFKAAFVENKFGCGLKPFALYPRLQLRNRLHRTANQNNHRFLA